MLNRVNRHSLISWLRAKIRALRIYYKTIPLFHETFIDYYKALWLPFGHGGTFHPRREAALVTVPTGFWTMLPTVCRLVAIGAHPQWQDGVMTITLGSFRFLSPPLGKGPGFFFKEVFVDDVYGLSHLDLTGQIALDVGAWIGDSSIFLAARGALVHAFEPSLENVDYLRMNIAANGLSDKIIIHPVGLSSHDHKVPDGRGGTLRFVPALSYLKEQGLGRIGFLKMDCEECEYQVLSPQFLEYLQPRWIALEYHQGGEGLECLLKELGYEVSWPERKPKVGYLRAVLRQS